MDAALITTAIEVAPEVIDYVKSWFSKKNPAAPEPTSEDVMAALESAFTSSRAQDEAWLLAHPTVAPAPAEPPAEPPATS